MREKIKFSEDWLFHRGEIERAFPKDKGPIYSQSKTERKIWGPACRYYQAKANNFDRKREICTDFWETVNLPHDYVILQELSQKENSTLGYLPYENAWYRKTFTLTEEDIGKRLFFLFEGVATYATVYCNGCIMKRNFCGYNSFTVDISDVAEVGENLLAVYVEAGEPEGWWYQGGGIYRPVWLIKTEDVAIDLWGIYAVPEKQSDETWQVKVENELVNDRYDNVLAEVVTTLYDKEKPIAKERSQVELLPREKGKASLTLQVKDPVLWGIENPYLYQVRTEVFIDGVLWDAEETRIGFRTFRIDPDQGFFLNEKPVKIKGVCAHQDFGITGKAVAENLQRHKIAMLKEMGANGFRTSHYPHSVATMDALDEMGFIVMDETRWFTSTEEGKEQLEMLIKRDRNRPSVFFWSVGNEEPHHLTEVGRRICKNLISFVKKLDHTRPVMTAVSDRPNLATVFDETDVIGINYNLALYDEIHQKYPQKGIFASECCATGTTRGWYDANSPEWGYISAYDKDTNNWFLGREKTWKFMMEREWILGEYQWTAFEHRGETLWPRLCSVSGAVDLFLQKKDAFYQNQSHWSDAPMVHLLPHWNFEGREGESIPVWVYSNCEEVELFLNGESLGRKKLNPGDHGEWSVPYQKGTLRAEGSKQGAVICVDEKTTTRTAKKLCLQLENTIQKANGEDVAIITCYCVDEEGREVPNATPFVNFHTNGLGKVIGSGSDNTDHQPPHLPVRKMYAGRITVAVQVGKTPGELKVYAMADGLADGVLTISLEV